MHARPVRLRHLPPAAEGGEPPFEHPFRLVLLGRDEADDVFVQALRRALHLDVGDEAVFVLLASAATFSRVSPSADMSASCRRARAMRAQRVCRSDASTASTSLACEFQPKLTRSAQRARSSDTPIAFSTCDGFTLPDEHAAAGADHHAVEIERHQRGLRGNAGHARNCEVLRETRRRRAEYDGIGPARCSSLSKRSRRRHSATSRVIACSNASAAAPKPAMPVTFSVPARWPRSCPPPAIMRRKRRTVLDDQRAGALQSADLVRRERQIIRIDIERDLAGRLHRIDEQQRPALRAQVLRPHRAAGSRRSRCSPPSHRQARGPCLHAASRAVLRDRQRRPPSREFLSTRTPGTRSAIAAAFGAAPTYARSPRRKSA